MHDAIPRRRGELVRIVRYPIKGLSGIDAEYADLHPGRGLRHDRSLAIERGSIPVASPQGWNPRETYFHVAKDEQIVHLETGIRDAESDSPVLTLGTRGGRSVDVRLGGSEFDLDRRAADALLRDALPAGPLGAPALSRTGVHLWDWPQAHLSIINLATVRALGDAVGSDVDGRRFRGNLYLDGLDPWEELSFLGQRIRLGSAVLEVFQPTDRCRATTIDPETAESNLNVPALLASRFGHMYCGVYARVIERGRITAGDRIDPDAGGSGAPALDHAEHEWPRSATIVEKRVESAGVTSFWLADPSGIASRAVPGQHIRVHIPGEPVPSWRCYTVSGVRKNAVRISVKRDGRVSSALHDRHMEDDRVLLSGPFGEVVLNEGDGDVLLLSAGVGITPTVAMLRGVAASGTPRRVRMLHVDRVAADVALWDELIATSAGLDDAKLRLFLTREDAEIADRIGARPGRPDATAWQEVLDELDPAGLAVYACGPGTFTTDIRQHLTALGVPEDAINIEVFFSPTAAELAEPREPSTTGPHTITFGTQLATWRRETGSTLDAVEGVGVSWPSGCRMGACGTCAQRLVSGEVEYLNDPLTPPRRGTVLVCCSVPISDVVFATD